MSAPTEARTRPRLDRSLWCLAGGLLVAVGFVMAKPAAFPGDDGFFYTQIARWWWDTGDVSFHGFGDTNGFHPLWWLVLVVVGAPVGAEGEAFVRLAFVAGYGVLVAGLWLAHRRWFRDDTLGFAVVVGVAGVVFVGKGGLYLLETYLAAGCVLWVLAEVTGESGPDRRGDLRLGLAMATMVLARLDLILITPLIAGFALHWRGRSFTRLVALAAPGVGLIGAYVIWNTAAFGASLPVSGQIKSHFPEVRFSFESLGFYGTGSIILTLVVGLHLTVRREPSPLRNALVVLVGANVIYLCWVAAFTSSTEWYYTLGYVLAPLWLAWAVQTIRARRALVLACAALIPTLAAARALTTFSITSGFLVEEDLAFRATTPRRDLADELQELLPAGTPLAFYDTPGIVAYYTDLRVVPVDGLVNSEDFSEELEAEGGLPWFCGRGIDHLVAPIPNPGSSPYYEALVIAYLAPDQWGVSLIAPESGTPTAPFVLTSDDLLWQGENPVPKSADTHPDIGLWRLPCPP